ncbi:hypothetical protein GCM10010503_34320 [Streptomyces lucensis JCM 4490]|uniref:Uncharacterized protein n=1 Tax=Streptomyces lucensis JCM 4490 TaxID=1306176 RepID=A0A918J7R3_9ACTN|nr:hypothetical protein [Streptomyces lucensis]GGW54220.1 hypothetical protein GCM10010503_34320 [Streptomyces lucensis JCM 4490]
MSNKDRSTVPPYTLHCNAYDGSGGYSDHAHPCKCEVRTRASRATAITQGMNLIAAVASVITAIMGAIKVIEPWITKLM